MALNPGSTELRAEWFGRRRRPLMPGPFWHTRAGSGRRDCLWVPSHYVMVVLAQCILWCGNRPGFANFILFPESGDFDNLPRASPVLVCFMFQQPAGDYYCYGSSLVIFFEFGH